MVAVQPTTQSPVTGPEEMSGTDRNEVMVAHEYLFGTILSERCSDSPMLATEWVFGMLEVDGHDRWRRRTPAKAAERVKSGC